MKKAFSLLLVSAIGFSLLTGCGSTSQVTSSGGGGNNNQPPATVPVSLTMTDDPPAGVSVLFFQVSLTAASLEPASGSAVSLITTPIQDDVTQLQALSTFLSTANVPAGPYNSLSLTFASPQLVIFNKSDQSIASTCAIGSVCQLTPTLDNSATVSLSGAPFPVTVAAGSPLGFLIDFHLNTIIQSDLSVNLQAANGVTLGQLPPSAPSQPPHFGSVMGSVVAVTSQTQFTLQTPWGKTFTIDTNSSTTIDGFPPSVNNICPAASIDCTLTAGQIVRVQVASVESDGDLLAAQVTYVQAGSQQTVLGTIVAIPPLPLPTGETMIQIILHQSPTGSSNLPVGGMANVAIWAPGTAGQTATTFSIDANGFTIPSGYTFASSSDLTVGQTVQVDVVAGSLTTPTGSGKSGGWGSPQSLSFTASSVQLEPTQFTGSVSNIGSSSFSLSGYPGFFFGPGGGSNSSQTLVETTSQTTYQGFSTDSFSGLEDGDVVSVNAWLFAQNGTLDPAVGPPIIVAQTITLHSGGSF